MCEHGPVAAGSLAAVSLLLTMVNVHAQPTNEEILGAFGRRFSRRSGEEMLELWHGDCHRRCREQLRGHVNLACTWDPYRVDRKKRSANSSLDLTPYNHGLKADEPPPKPRAAAPSTSTALSSLQPFLGKNLAASFLGGPDTQGTGGRRGHKRSLTHVRAKRSIMRECCYSKSCSWEEFAEYCHTHNRATTDRQNTCLR